MKKLSLSAKINYTEHHGHNTNIENEIVTPFSFSFKWDYQDYLEIIKSVGILDDYDKLIIEAKIKIKNNPSEKCIVEDQPIWDISDDYSKEVQITKSTEEDLKFDNCWNKNGKPIFDIPAWYQPAHFNPPNEYGIYITRWGIVSYAESIINMNSKISREEALVSALALLWWHELSHAWIEDICSLIESLTGDNHYSGTLKRYNSYIFMEEAICNSSAYGNLASVLDVRKPIGGANFTENTITNKQNILDAVKKIFRGQRKGYSDFYEFDCWVHVKKIFFSSVAKLIHEVYEYESFSVQHALASFFDTARIIEKEVFTKRDKKRLHNIDYGAYGHTHRRYPSEESFHTNTLSKTGGELYYKYSTYGVHLI
jgi:hypothetical protein